MASVRDSSNWASASGAGDAPASGWMPGRQRPGGVAQAGAGDEAAQPIARADPLAEIDDEVELAGARAQVADLVAERRTGGRPPIEAAVESERGRAAARAHADIVDLIQGCEALAPLNSPAAHPARQVARVVKKRG